MKTDGGVYKNRKGQERMRKDEKGWEKMRKYGKRWKRMKKGLIYNILKNLKP